MPNFTCPRREQVGGHTGKVVAGVWCGRYSVRSGQRIDVVARLAGTNEATGRIVTNRHATVAYVRGSDGLTSIRSVSVRSS